MSCSSARSITQQQLWNSRRPAKSHDFDSNLSKSSSYTRVKNTVFSRMEAVVQMEK